MEVYHQYIRKRKDFGRHPKFMDEGAEMLADIRPNEEHAKETIEKNPVMTSIQCIPELSEHEVNTNAVIFTNKAMSHVEGGWPKDIDYTEAEHTIRYHKKVERDEMYIKSVSQMSCTMENLVKQNNAIDIYEEYFNDIISNRHEVEIPEIKTIAVLKDPNDKKRWASYIDFHPDGSRKIAIAYSIMAFQRQPNDMSLTSYIWDIHNPNTPDLSLLPTSQLCCLKFNLKDNNLIGAGQYNGQFCCFDVRKGGTCVEASPIEASHRDAIFDFAWIQCKTGTEAMSTSTDGNVFWWDIRKLQEPLEQLSLKEKNSNTLLGGVTLEYDPTAGLTKFMIGTEQGLVLNCNRKAKNPTDRVGTSYLAHSGPVTGLKRNPFFPKFFLTAGDWTTKIFNEDLKTPLYSTKYAYDKITCGTWSPTRPSVFYLIKANGTLQIWDLSYNCGKSILDIELTNKSLISFKIKDSGSLCATGDLDGNTYILEMSKGLFECIPNEKQLFNAMLERETLREKNLEKSLKEAKIKLRREAARKDEVIETISSTDIKNIEDDFFKKINIPLNDS